jgi:hypothetical protein
MIESRESKGHTVHGQLADAPFFGKLPKTTQNLSVLFTASP